MAADQTMEEDLEFKANMDVDEDAATHLAAEDSPLTAPPQIIPVTTKAKSKAKAKAKAAAAKASADGSAPPGPPEDSQVSPLNHAMDINQEILEKAGEADKLATSLADVKYGNHIVKDLNFGVTKLRTLFSKI